MKRSSAAPNISAPLSRSGARRSKSSLNPICVAATTLLLILISLGGILLFFSRSNHLESHNNQREAQEQTSQLRRQQKQSTDSIREEKRNASNTRGLLIRTNQIGDIRISFRPDLSGPTSIQYIIDVVEAAAASSPQTDGSNNNGVTCDRCKFYRAETKLLLQGVIAQHSVSNNGVTLGPCPIENYKPKLECPPHDPNCGCHGPVMTKGMVGWAGGAKGPDFFLNTFEREVDWWENQHTVWGELDEESIRVVESAYDLPAHGKGMRTLDEAINFSIELF
jgi:hypothetical protein